MRKNEPDPLRRLLVKTPLLVPLMSAAASVSLAARAAPGVSAVPQAGQTLLLKNADVVVTMDDKRREIKQGCVYIKGNTIVAVGAIEDVPQTAIE